MMNPIESARRHSLGDLLRRSAARAPDKLAIICGEQRYSYAELDALCDRVAGAFAARGLRPGDRVAMLARNSAAFVAIRFGLARLGAVLVPINFMLKPGEISYILNHSGARVLCVDSSCEENGRQAIALGAAVEWIVAVPGEVAAAPEADASFDELANGPVLGDDHIVDARALAQIIYTSGTESAPKGAMLTHEAVMWEYVTCVVDAEIRANDIALHAMPLYHCAQLDAFLGPSLYVGATNIITAQTAPEQLLAFLQRYEVTNFFAPPTIWISLLRCPDFAKADLSALRTGYYGASIMPVEVLRELQSVLPKVNLYNLYGQTEIAPLATVLGPEDQLRRAGSAGRAGLNIETRVVDEDGREVAPGEIGEIVHRSPQLLTGYYNDEARTAEAFRSGWFHSGDLATRDADGYITIVDRKKDMIKTGGENVASREVEETLYRLPGVGEVAVIGVPHPTWVEAVVAIIVPKIGTELSEQAVLAHASKHLAGFKVPKRVLLVDELPKNPSGKIMKRVLRDSHLGLFK